MSPIDYSIDVQSPFQSALQGFQAGNTIQTMQRQQQMQAAQQQRMTDMQRAAAVLAQDPTPQNIAKFSIAFPEMSEQAKRSYDMLQPAQQEGRLQMATPIYAAVVAGRNDVAATKLRDTATAMENSGDARNAQVYRTYADLVEQHPEQAKVIIGTMLAGVMGPDKFSTTFGQLGEESRKQALAPAEQAKAEAEAKLKGVEAANAPGKAALDAANVRSQIEERAGRLRLDKDRLTSEVQLKLYELGQKASTLDDGAKKLVNDSTVAAVAADQSANQMIDLADKLEQSGATSGVAAKGAELYKSLTGNQDAVTQLRQEYTRLRSTQVSKMLPPGPASDKDIQLALAGFPAETADAATMAAFVRGMAKLQQYEAVSNNAKAEWVNAVGHLGKPKTDIEIDGVKVPAGSTFVEFSREFMSRKADELAARTAARLAQGRGYMRFATQQPGAAPAVPGPNDVPASMPTFPGR